MTTVGSNTCKVTITDSRGKTATKSTTFTVLAYTVPTINTFTAVRNSSTNTTINVTYKSTITSLNNRNTKSNSITTSVSSGNKLPSAEQSAYTTDSSLNITGANASNSYTVTFTIADKFSTVTKTINIGTAFKMMHFSADGKHVAIGQMYDSSKDVNLQIAKNLTVGGCTITWND